MKLRAGPSGVHLFDRLTGRNLLLDEVRVPPSRWATAPRQVSVALTNACDLSCAFCYAPKSAAQLGMGQVCRWLAELDARGCLGVGFGGGEPTLHPRFADICRFAATETGLAVTFTTHAHRLDDQLAAALSGNVHFVRVSMDGVGRTYEAVRGRSFNALRSRLGVVRRLARFGLNVVVNRHTFPDLDAVAGVAAESGAAELLLLPERPVRGAGGIDPATQAALAGWVNAYRGPVPVTASAAGAAGLPICDPLAGEGGLGGFAHIDASGVLKRSSFDADGVPIGAGGVMQALTRLRNLAECRP
jgi:hypothetical protein